MKLLNIRSSNILIILIFTIIVDYSFAQEENRLDSTQKKNIILNSVALGATTFSYFGLYNLWYKNYQQTSFHFFNDLEEWNYMDKAGHVYSSYQVARKSHLFLNKKNIKNSLEKSCFYSLFFMLGIEVLDGFSEKWGFSNYDLLSNFVGTGIFYFQQKKFKRQSLKLKFSSHLSPYAIHRPSLLGDEKNISQRIFKDYNGQTYWLTFDFDNDIQNRLKVFKYLNFSLGYSIDGFIGARNNNILNCAECNEINRQSQLLFSVDLDFSEIKTKNRVLELLLNSFSLIKFPAPTLILQDQNEFKWFYF